MTDLTADLESTGIPTLPHKAYVMKVFFPGVIDHPILNDPKVSQVRHHFFFSKKKNASVGGSELENLLKPSFHGSCASWGTLVGRRHSFNFPRAQVLEAFK